MSLFGRLGRPGPPQDARWARSPRGKYFRLIHLDPEEVGLSGVGGIYVVWHGGVRPRWVCVGRTDDLAASYHRLGADKEVMSFEVNGGLFTTWSLIRAEHREGVLAYLDDVMQPLVPTPGRPGADVRRVPVVPPGFRAVEEP